MTVAIRVDNLSKGYWLGQAKESGGYKTLRESLMSAVAAPFRPRSEDTGQFWALKDVGFGVRSGEVVGIIGRNGAGKSTLLKILSRITKPTTGQIILRGQVASLLEVGTGFHPELTGRENIYLNGAILGMSRAKIARKFDEIAAFAETEQFLDVPVKRYSSGMYVRLAFAVAAHLEPEILIIDEVLAVGDAAFQKKCLGKMQEVGCSGRTVLFVSHNMAAISALCNRVVLLENGKVTFDGPSQVGVERYSLAGAMAPAVDLTAATNRQGPREHARFAAISLFNKDRQPCDNFFMGEPMTVELEIECSRRLKSAEVGFSVANALGVRIHMFVSTWEGLHCDLIEGWHRFRISVPKLLVYPGTYTVTPFLKRSGQAVDDQVDAAISFAVMEADLTGHRPFFKRYTHSKCEVYCPSRWRHSPPTEINEPSVSGDSLD